MARTIVSKVKDMFSKTDSVVEEPVNQDDELARAEEAVRVAKEKKAASVVKEEVKPQVQVQVISDTQLVYQMLSELQTMVVEIGKNLVSMNERLTALEKK